MQRERGRKSLTLSLIHTLPYLGIAGFCMFIGQQRSSSTVSMIRDSAPWYMSLRGRAPNSPLSRPWETLVKQRDSLYLKSGVATASQPCCVCSSVRAGQGPQPNA